jgi:hypothetical protein
LRRLGLHLLYLALFAPAPLAAGHRVDSADTKVPSNLVLDVRLYEARSTRPDFDAMENLSFFIDTDGSGVTDPQWLATILRKTPDSVLAALAYECLPVEGGKAKLSLSKRTRAFEMTVDLDEFSEKGSFAATSEIALVRGDEVLRKFERRIELRLGQTYVWGSRNLEISASDYLSHFRDFENTDDRGKLYESLRGYSFFLLLAVTPRLTDEIPSEPMVVAPNESVSLGKIESPLGVAVEGEIQVELTLDGAGTPIDARVVRSSVPELNLLVLGEASSWHFPEAAGKKARLAVELHAVP